MADPIFASYGKEMQKKRGYWIEGIGGSAPNGDVRYLFMSFVGISEVDIPEARRLYIEVVEGLLDRVNQDKFIRPFLHDYPSTSKNTWLQLGFVDRYNKPVKEDLIAFVSCVNDTVYYRIFNHNTRLFEEVHDEPYEEALRIVQSESNKS
jgi:hypothetical protein